MKPTALIPLLMLMNMPIYAETALTIYNNDFAVVRENVPLTLKAGRNDAHYADMVAHLEADSVILRDPAGKVKFQILEQSYRNDAVSQELLLALFEGKTIDFLSQEANKADVIVPGKIIRSGYKTHSQPVIEVNGKLRFSLPGQPLFPSLGDDTVLNPTLSWKIETAQDAKFEAELAYISGGFDWAADYNIVAPEQGDKVDVIGWVTIHNQSGKTFKDARVKLMAGDVNKLQPQAPQMVGKAMRLMAVADALPETVSEKAFDEFHLYTLNSAIALRDQESKQVEFIRASGVKMERIYVYDGAELGGWRVGMLYGENPGYGSESNKKVAVYREFKNSKDNHLGMPLPKGRVRFYAQDPADQSLQFVGENQLDHTPKDEWVRLYTGDAFDLVGERKRTDFRVDSNKRKAQESFEIRLRNRKQESVEIRVVEHLFRWTNWEIKDKSQAFEKTNAQTVEFRVALKADEEKTVSYTVYYSW